MAETDSPSQTSASASADPVAGAEGPQPAAPKVDVFEDFKEMLAEQSERQARLRHVQQFLTSPVFFDLRDAPIEVSDPPEVIEERKRDLDYRIKVLESLVSLLIEERDALDRTVSAADAAAEAAVDIDS